MNELRWRDYPVVQRRFIFYSLVATLIFLMLLLRLWYLQVISHDALQQRSVSNRTRMLSLEAPRGPIYDRRGRLLVTNRPAFQISVMRQDVQDPAALLQRLSVLLELEPEVLQKRWQEGQRLPSYRPVPLAMDVSRATLERIQEQGVELPGVLTEVKPVRAYPEQGSAAHLLGYLGEITKKELKSTDFDSYRGGDFVGKTALERAYESQLRGSKGKKLLEVDVQGNLLRQLEMEPSRPGLKAYLTLDRDLQRAADRAFGSKAGAAIALDVSSGEVLAMVSRPTFNPALFARGIQGQEWRQLAQDARHPLQNKAIAGQYPPGSIFKIVVALAALREGTATTDTVVHCDGDFELAESRYRCWKNRGHKDTDLRKALRESCDVWFYQIGLKLGIDKLSQAAREFGLGAPTGYPLPGERAGVMPSQEWKQQRFNRPWYAGETVIAAIGQGFVLTTPMQLAVMTAAVANGGKILKPRVIRTIEDWDGKILQQSQRQIVRQLDYSSATWKAVRQALVDVVNAPHGTGHSARMEDVLVAGKTGTSQVVRRKSDEEEEQEQGDDEVPRQYRAHALFVAYAPADNPEIAVAVIVEHGESGGRTAGPIAKEIIARYFELNKDRAGKQLVEAQ